MALAVGTRLGPYEILATIGAGGMGEVYKAADTRLGRVVAIKFLKEPHAHRFQREAQAIAALNHPHICALYDVGDDFLVMEYLEGTPLSGPLGPSDAVRVGLQIVAALEAAHARGIIHRDLKPANILVTPSGVKLLDFGLAKMPDERADETRMETMAGTVMGTAAYMSPEQARGQTADVRSDIFSFGAVLYEMLGGRRAFDGESPAATLAAVMRDDPPSLDAPPALGAIVARCLRKRPEERYQTIAELRRALEAAGGTPPQADRAAASIAVLPFATIGDDKDSEFFSDGLAEDILNALTRIPHLRVTARTSSFAFRGRDQDIRSIARMLDVRTILEGSVRRSGTRIRVSAQLINAADGYHLWSDRYDRELDDVFAVQDEIAAAIAAALRMTLAAPAADRYVPAFPAYEALLQGRHHFFQQTSDSLVQAMACYERAAALDPDYPNPHDELGACHMLLWYWGIKPGREMVPIVRREVARTEALGHLSPWGQAMRGVVEAAYEYDREAARRLLTAGLTDREGYRAESRWCYATFHLVPAGRFDEAIDTLETSLVEDPLNVVWRAAIAHFQNLAGRHERAREQLDAVHRITRGYWVSHLYLAEVWVAAGRWAEALAEAEEAHRLAPWNARVLGMLAAIAGRLGDTARAEAVTARLAQGPPHWGAEGMVLHALVTGDTGAAADWYARAVAHRNVWVLVESRGWNTRALRASASWAALAASMRI